MPTLPPSVRWPMPFVFQPADATLLDRADHVFDLRASLRASPADALAALFDVTQGLDVPGLFGATWQGPPVFKLGAVYDERFAYMTLRLRVIEHEPASRIAVCVDACTLPLGQRMVQLGEATPRATGGCDLRWRIGLELLPWTRPAAGVVFPLFHPTFDGTMTALKRRFGAA